MDCIFNKEKIKKVLFDFYSSTGIAVTLYDASERVVATSPIYSGCCSRLREIECCVKSCDESNLINMEVVSQSRKMHCYACHAGLMEAILPIEYDGVLIAYMQLGQFRDKEGIYSSAEKIKTTAVRYGFSKEELLSLYSEIPVISREKLDSLRSIMEILIKSFWEDGLIYYNRSMMSVKIEQYVTERLAEKIYVEDICKKFSLSKNGVYQLFKNEFGTTVNEFIAGKRLSAARELLQSETKLNVTQVALRCGFPDYNYFIRLFKERYGVSPLRFKKNYLSTVNR